MVETTRDLYTLYKKGDYEEFLNAIPFTSFHRRPNNLYDMVKDLANENKFPKEIAELARIRLSEEL